MSGDIPSSLFVNKKGFQIEDRDKTFVKSGSKFFERIFENTPSKEHCSFEGATRFEIPFKDGYLETLDILKRSPNRPDFCEEEKTDLLQLLGKITKA